MKMSDAHSLVALPEQNDVQIHDWRVTGLRVLTYAVMVALILIMVLPFAWMLSTSLKTQQYILKMPPDLLPNPLSFESYVQLNDKVNVVRTFLNSLFVAVVGTAGQVFIASMAAYAFSRMEWRGRNAVFMLYLATIMIPGVVLVIPQFIVIRAFGWANTYQALIVPSLFSAFGTFLLRQAFLSLPKDFEEAAYLDGANRFTIFWRVMLPLVTLTVLSFMSQWNSYLWPLFVARKEAVMTLPVALATLQASPQALTQWNLVMAGAVITVLPILIIYLLAQKWFVQSVVSGGLKV